MSERRAPLCLRMERAVLGAGCLTLLAAAACTPHKPPGDGSPIEEPIQDAGADVDAIDVVDSADVPRGRYRPIEFAGESYLPVDVIVELDADPHFTTFPDVDGDGIDELVFRFTSYRTPGHTDGYPVGAIYVVPGSAAQDGRISTDEATVIHGPFAGSGFGWSANTIGDLDRDGLPELVVASEAPVSLNYVPATGQPQRCNSRRLQCGGLWIISGASLLNNSSTSVDNLDIARILGTPDFAPHHHPMTFHRGATVPATVAVAASTRRDEDDPRAVFLFQSIKLNGSTYELTDGSPVLLPTPIRSIPVPTEVSDIDGDGASDLIIWGYADRTPQSQYRFRLDVSPHAISDVRALLLALPGEPSVGVTHALAMWPGNQQYGWQPGSPPQWPLTAFSTDGVVIRMDSWVADRDAVGSITMAPRPRVEWPGPRGQVTVLVGAGLLAITRPNGDVYPVFRFREPDSVDNLDPPTTTSRPLPSPDACPSDVCYEPALVRICDGELERRCADLFHGSIGDLNGDSIEDLIYSDFQGNLLVFFSQPSQASP